MVYTVVAAGGGMSKSGSMYHFVSVVVPVMGKAGLDYDFQFDASGRIVDYKEVKK